ncbi:McrC family protein [Pararhodonellum marinum]|uniref:McrC family protein n=1 Tax=Pararhodonellum marinum TaxID=2755358 RepID=UPI00188EDAE2|nr:restriction endonuclease [Pararhodonellum marinum]
MNTARNYITVFEHQSIKLDQEFPNNGKFDVDVLVACQRFYGEKGIPYFDLIHNGIRFKEFVGVIQVGNTLIEVLPKSDKPGKVTLLETAKWQKILLGMLKAVNGFDVQTPSSSNLSLKSNTILDMYFELFIKEVEFLLHAGLIKKYRKVKGNVNALKGSLQFGKHIQYNLVHQERFFVKHTVYDVSHTLHYILYKTLRLLKLINTNSALHSRIGALLLHFPEMPDIKVSESFFEKIILNRKSQSYQKAFQISRLLLLHYHPDLSKGRNHVLALMFDMNELWEQFVAISLRKQKGFKVHTQKRKYFWSPSTGPRRTIRPDILIEVGKSKYVLDTKWKLLSDNRPSVKDIRQMYAYHHYFEAEKVALVYPGELNGISGKYVEIDQSKDSSIECSLIFLPVGEDVKKWQDGIGERFFVWVGMT